MSALVRKEIRLLLPAWIAAMLLVCAPIPLAEVLGLLSPSNPTFPLTVYGVAIGCLLLGLAGFGREMSAHTFSLLLAQPRPRTDLWRAKVGVLLVSLVPLALLLGLVNRQLVPPHLQGELALAWFVAACVAVSGGLWTTLLLRQVVASFWISILVPFAILVSVLSLDDEVAEPKTRTLIATVLLLAYAVAGYCFARWQFLRAQDVAWTGGNVSLPGAARWLPWIRSATAHRKSHPLRALLGKELQFQQINFLLAGLLLVAQLALLLLRMLVNTSEPSLLDMIVEHFWGIWIVMPLLVGGGAVAEERKLGTLDSQLCQPVPRAWQFAVKVFVTLACGILLGALVPVALATIHPTAATQGGDFVLGWTLACACLALVSLYASSLSNQMLQAFGTAIGITVVGWLLGSWFAGAFSRGHEDFSLFGLTLWRGPLVLVVGSGVMLAAAMALTWRRRRWLWGGFLVLIALLVLGMLRTLPAILAPESHVFGVRTIVVVIAALALCPAILTLVLAAKNFNHARISPSLWWRNTATWLGCLLLTAVITTLVYNRAWEPLMRLEPPAGPPRLGRSVPQAIAGTFIHRPTVVLLPDGRLCAYTGYERIPSPVTQGQSNQAPAREPAWRTVENPRVEFIGGSNWVTIAVTARELVGVKTDGSLWSAPWFEQEDAAGNVIPLRTGMPMQKGLKARPTGLKFEHLGTETDWVSVAAGWQHCVALKRDGTIWGWGGNDNRQLGDGPKAITNGFAQIGTETDWIAVFASSQHTFAVNRAGDIWKWGVFAVDIWGRAVEEGPVKLNLKVAGVRSISSENNFDLVLDTDGILWGLGRIPPSLIGAANDQFHRTPRKLSGENWSVVNEGWPGFAGIRHDGTLWSHNQPGSAFLEWRPVHLVQLGRRTDWITVSKDWDSVLALAKDGTICRFGKPVLQPGPVLLAPTRRVTWSMNLLDAAK